jgi:TP901 family phage tail tape measure protein
VAISAAELLGIVTIRGADEGVLKLARVGASADSAGAKLAGLAVGGTVLAAAGFVALGAAAVKMDADLQQGVNRLKTGGGDIQDTFASLRSSIQSVALMSGVLTGPLTDAMYLIVSAGQRGTQALATEAAAAQGAQIEMANVVDVTKVLTTLQTNWGLSTYTAAQYMDGLVSVVSHGKINLEDLSTKLSAILPIAAEFGISFKDIASAMAVETNAGMQAAQSATGLQAVMVNLENPTKKASDAMKKFGVDGTAVANEMKVSLPGAFQMLIDAALKVGPMGSVPFNQAMADMIGGGTRTSKTIDALDQHMTDWLADIKSVNTAMGDTSKNVAGWDTAQSNLNVQIEKGQAFLQVMGQNIGEELLPYVSQLLADVLPLGESFAKWATSTQGLAGYINQLASFITYLVRDVQNNGALKEFGAILSDIGSTVNNVLNAGMLALSTIFGTTASNAGKASDAAGNVADGLKRVLDTVKPVTDAMSWLSQQFADSGTKGKILRDVLLTIGGAFAGIKIAEFGTAAVKAFDSALISVRGYGLVTAIAATDTTALATATASAGTSAAAARGWFVQLEATLDGTATSAVAANTAFSGMGTSVKALGLALGPIIGIATGVRLALSAIPSTMPQVFSDMGAQVDKFTMSIGGMWHMVNDDTQKGSQKVVLDFHNMYQGATDNTTRLKSGVTLAANQMSNGMIETVTYLQAQASGKFKLLHDDGSNYADKLKANMTTAFFNMHKQVYSETQAMSSDAVAAMARLNGDMTDQASSMDANVIGYWNDVANYIAGHPINGNVTYTVQSAPGGSGGQAAHYSAGGWFDSPGGFSWTGERGRELLYVPPGASIIPHQQSERIAAGGGSGQPVVIQFVVNGRQLAQAALPDFVAAIRDSTGAKF